MKLKLPFGRKKKAEAEAEAEDDDVALDEDESGGDDEADDTGSSAEDEDAPADDDDAGADDDGLEAAADDDSGGGDDDADPDESADDGDEDDDVSSAGTDDDHPDISKFFGGGGDAAEDVGDDGAAEIGVTEDDYEDDEDRRPLWRNPILWASLSLLLVVGVALGSTAVSFDRAAFEAANAPPTVVAALPPPPSRAAPAAEAPALADGAAAAAAAPAPQQAAAATPAPPPAAAPPPPAATPPAATPPAAPPAAQAAVPAAPAPAPGNPQVALAPAPDPALIAAGEAGPLPIKGEDGREPWRVYARPFALPAEMPKVGIVIGGLGLSRAATQAAIQQLPPEVTLAFVPYAPNLEEQIAEARAAGHEVVLQLPMEPNGYPANDPGPHTLLANATPEDNIQRLHRLLSRFTGYVGVTNYMGAKMSANAGALRPILADLHIRGLMFLDARETTDSVAGALAAEVGMPRAISNRFLDTEASRTNVDARLLELERIATTQGGAVGIGYAYPVTIERVATWIHSLRGKNVAIAPISALARTSTTN